MACFLIPGIAGHPWRYSSAVFTGQTVHACSFQLFSPFLSLWLQVPELPTNVNITAKLCYSIFFLEHFFQQFEIIRKACFKASRRSLSGSLGGLFVMYPNLAHSWWGERIR